MFLILCTSQAICGFWSCFYIRHNWHIRHCGDTKLTKVKQVELRGQSLGRFPSGIVDVWGERGSFLRNSLNRVSCLNRTFRDVDLLARGGEISSVANSDQTDNRTCRSTETKLKFSSRSSGGRPELRQEKRVSP
jgi:hypothetical protein